jgi:predicted deacylase
MKIYDELIKILNKNYKKNTIEISKIGKIEDYSIFWIEKPHEMARASGLIVAGFHGDEPAPCMAVIEFIEKLLKNEINTDCNISIIPIVNPTGLELRKRYNKWGQDPNRGFIHDFDNISIEGEIIKNHLLNYHKKFDAMISLHEDIDETKFYLYTFENQAKPGEFSYILRDAGAEFFAIKNDQFCEEGIIFNEHDGSFEDFMFHLGVHFTACTETPGKFDIDLRIKANIRLIKSFIYFLENLKRGDTK